MDVRFDIEGRVTNSERENHRVWVQADPDDTGGYFVLQAWDGLDGPGELGVFDDWVETREDLDEYLGESGWQIEWLPNKPMQTDRPSADR